MKSWCTPKITREFLRRLKGILMLYQQPYDPRRPMVCFDEKNVQLLADSRPDRPMQPGRVRRQDYEYVRHGTRNLFIFLEPKAGYRHVLITCRRTKVDWAKAIRYLAEVLYPHAEQIDLVYDNLNTHLPETLIEIFGKAEADRLLARLALHPTPVHASWLNMAEIDLSAMTGQCLKGRLPDEWSLALELIAWETRRNCGQKPIAWSFNWRRARRMFKAPQDATPGRRAPDRTKQSRH